MNPAAILAALSLVAPPAPSVQASEPPEALVHVVIAAAAVGQFTDLSTTMYAMGTGRFREANPLFSWAEDEPLAMGIVKGSIAAGLTYGLIQLHRTRPKTALAAAIGMLILQSCVTAKNLQTIRRGGGR